MATYHKLSVRILLQVLLSGAAISLSLGTSAQAYNAGNVYISGKIYLAGSFTNDSAANFLNNGSFQLSGNFTNNQTNMEAGLVNSSGSTLLISADTQFIKGSKTSNFHNLTVNNTSAKGLTLNSNVTISGSLNLTYGLINTQSLPPAGSGYSANTLGLLLLGPSASIGGSISANGAGGSLTTMINGRMGKQFNAAGTEFVFPIGKLSPSAAYRPPGVVPTTTDGTTTFYAEYFPFAHPIPSLLMDPNLFGIIKPEHWDIHREDAKTTKARVKLPYINPGTGNWILNDNDQATDPITDSKVAVTHKTEDSRWTLTKALNNLATAGPYLETRSVAEPGAVYSNEVNSFSPFSIGYTYNGILPLSNAILGFDGGLSGTDALLKWKVSNVKNLASFELQQSVNGQNFGTVASIRESGENYEYRHRSPAPGINYYRLLLKEKDGTTKYSRTIFIVLGTHNATIIGLQCNPVHHQAVLNIYSEKNQSLKVNISTLNGQPLKQQAFNLQKGNNNISINTLGFVNGLYLLDALTESGTHTLIKFVKH